LKTKLGKTTAALDLERIKRRRVNVLLNIHRRFAGLF